MSFPLDATPSLGQRPFISGAMHYFRIPRAYWQDRLEKLINMGCDTVETYIPWNLHQPAEDCWVFDGDLDVIHFIELAGSLELSVIIRPSPYICAEFEFGGLPWWLLKDRDMRVRSRYAGFLAQVDRYYDQLLPRLVPLLPSNGGPIIACQVENEYGYYSDDHEYLKYLAEALRKRGIDVPLFTADGPWNRALEYGKLDGALQTLNCGSDLVENIKKLRGLFPEDPAVVMEFWVGWFDTWGEEHHTRDPQEVARELESILKEGASVNIYMFHGGTNFGLSSGANDVSGYSPDTTSYDYHAPLSEWGEEAETYRLLRQVIGRHRPVREVPISTQIERRSFHSLHLQGACALSSSLELFERHLSLTGCKRMEALDQGYGYILYRLTLDRVDPDSWIEVTRIADRAQLFFNGRPLGTFSKGFRSDLPAHEGPVVLELLVENQGRVNFGHSLNYQSKGIDGSLLIRGYEPSQVEHILLPCDRVPDCSWKEEGPFTTPSFYRYSFSVEASDTYQDTFLDLSGWGKGVVWVNERNIGRFWDIGPQRALYIPGAFLKQGENVITIFETEGRQNGHPRLTDTPMLG